jgi:hypothetical protein
MQHERITTCRNTGCEKRRQMARRRAGSGRRATTNRCRTQIRGSGSGSGSGNNVVSLSCHLWQHRKASNDPRRLVTTAGRRRCGERRGRAVACAVNNIPFARLVRRGAFPPPKVDPAKPPRRATTGTERTDYSLIMPTHDPPMCTSQARR